MQSASRRAGGGAQSLGARPGQSPIAFILAIVILERPTHSLPDRFLPAQGPPPVSMDFTDVTEASTAPRRAIPARFRPRPSKLGLLNCIMKAIPRLRSVHEYRARAYSCLRHLDRIDNDACSRSSRNVSSGVFEKAHPARCAEGSRCRRGAARSPRRPARGRRGAAGGEGLRRPSVRVGAVGEKVIKSVTPGQMVVKLVHDELVALPLRRRDPAKPGIGLNAPSPRSAS